jgi:hypothetical protein
MILEDFVMLGKTIPEPTSDGRIFVCSAGFSEDLRSLVRLYPLARRDCPPRWSRSRVAVERNPRDSRRESFALKGNRNPSDHADINRLFETTIELSPKDRDHLVERIVDRSIADLNANRRSLGVLQPEGVAKLHFDENPASPDSPQLSLFADSDEEKRELGARRFAYLPRLTFKDLAGDWHDLQLRDWGGFEFLRKHGDHRRHELSDALHLNRRPSLLVGNMSSQRNAWLVISVLPPPLQADMFNVGEA